MNIKIVIEENTKLSEIAAQIEVLPLGEKVEIVYVYANRVFTMTINSDDPIIDLNIKVLQFMVKCQAKI